MAALRHHAVVGLLVALSGNAALAEVVPVVAAKNPVQALSRNQMNDVFLGRTSRLPDGSPAVPVDQSEDSPRRSEFYATFVGKSPAQLKAHWSKIIFTGRGSPPQEVGGDAEVKRALANNPAAIGYIDSSAVDASVKVVKVTP